MTQLQSAREGVVTEAMKAVAEREGVDSEAVRAAAAFFGTNSGINFLIRSQVPDAATPRS